MSGTVTPLFMLGLATFLLGWLFLYVAAFRSGWKWGLVCLLVPPALLVLIPLRWHRTQYGLYMVLSGMLICGASLYAGADGPVQAWLQRPGVKPVIARFGWDGSIHMPFKPYHAEPLPNAAAAAAAAQAEAKSAAPPPPAKPKPAAPAPAPSTFQPAGLDTLGKYLGKTVRITDINGGTVNGVLNQVDSSGVTVMANEGSGSVSYHLTWPRVGKAEIYAPAGSIPAPAVTKPAANASTVPAPTSTQAKPAAVTPAPASTLAKPAAVTPAPASTQAKPAAVTPAPASTQAKPATAAPAPAPAQAKPSAVSPAPASTQAKPATATPAPAAPQAAPAKTTPVPPVTVAPKVQAVPLPHATTQAPAMPIAPPAAAAQAPSNAVNSTSSGTP